MFSEMRVCLLDIRNESKRCLFRAFVYEIVGQLIRTTRSVRPETATPGSVRSTTG